MLRHYSFIENAITRLLLVSSDRGLLAVHFIPQDAPLPDVEAMYPDFTVLDGRNVHDSLHQQLHLYFQGVPVTFDTPLDLHGTTFQLSVWRAIQEIPHGKIRTYGEIAHQLGNPKGSRAVGGATGKNPLPIIIPCHRVLGRNHALTGFSAPDGILLKKKLLRLEGIQ